MANYYLYNKYSAVPSSYYTFGQNFQFTKIVSTDPNSFYGYNSFSFDNYEGLSEAGDYLCIIIPGGGGYRVLYSVPRADMIYMYDTDGITVAELRAFAQESTVYSKGSLRQSNIEAVDGTYPSGGEQGGYYYERGSQITAPSITTTSPATLIGVSSARISGNLTATNNGSTTRGFQWGTTVTDNSYSVGVGGVGAFSHDISSLTANTLVYFRTYATNIAGTTYGTTYSFTTSPASLPTLNTITPVTNLTVDSATISGKVLTNGGENPTTFLQWGTTVTDHTVGLGVKPVGTYSTDLAGLSIATKYYYRIGATNSGGTAYGETYSFTTLKAPTVESITPATRIASSTARLGGNLTDIGSGNTIRGFQWGTVVTENTHSLGVGGIGLYSYEVGSLTNETLYYYRAYATNEGGTVYGETYSFTTTEAGSFSETYTIVLSLRSNELLNAGAYLDIGATTLMTTLIKNNILTDSVNGIISASQSDLACLDVYDLNGNKILDFEKGDILKVGDIVRVDKDNNGTSIIKKSSGDPIYWKIVGRAFSKSGVPQLALKFREII